MSKKPRTLKLDQLELAALESVEIALNDRTGALNATATTAADPAQALAYQQPVLVLSGFLPCEGPDGFGGY
jgi:hypothetical protein